MALLQRREPGELDDATPLLDADCPALGSQGVRWYRKAQAALRQWWAVTTDNEFLSSAASRRGTWGVVLPTLATLLGVVCDTCNGEPWRVIMVDVVAAVLASSFRWLPRATLWSDVTVGSWMVLWTLAYRLVTSYSSALVDVAGAVGLVELYCLGVHSSVIAGCAVSLTLADAMVSSAAALSMVVGGALVTTGAAFHEYPSAELFRQLRTQLLATKELLDSAGDGFCTLDTTSRRIAYASPKLQRTCFTSATLEGVCFDELVVASDLDRFRELCVTAEAGGVLNSVLVTCKPLGGGSGDEGEATPLTFDARLLPHLACTGEFSLCIQVQGEVRCGPAAPGPAPPVRAQGPGSLGSLSVSITTGSLAASRRSAHTVRRGLRISTATQTVSSPPQLPQAEESSAATPLALRMFRMRLKSRRRLLPRFRETPAHTLQQVIAEAVRSINPRGSGCCAWHVMCLVVMREARKQLLNPCRPDFLPKQGFQCPACLAMNELDDEDDELECSVCSAPCQLPVGPVLASSDDTAADDEADGDGQS